MDLKAQWVNSPLAKDVKRFTRKHTTKDKNALYEINLLDKLDLERRLQIASLKDLKHSPIEDNEAFLRLLLFPFLQTPET